MKFVLLLLALLPFLLAAAQPADPPYYRGVDLSYVNEMEDCGAIYRVDGEPRDPYQIFADAGANLVRLRLWNDPDWTDYSTLNDVIRSSRRAKDAGMGILLDFHYSDTWADPSKQTIPAAWADLDDDALAAALYGYTYDTLMTFDAEGLMPDIVQVGNKINSQILRSENTTGYPIDWERNAALLNRALAAVRAAGAQAAHTPRTMLHVAKPEEVEGWLLAAERAGVTDFELIGISYYPGWSTHTITTAANTINRLRYQFGKDVMIVETAYPFTLVAAPESAGNILNASNLLPGYPASPAGQRQFLIDLSQAVYAAGGLGIVYWEPAWVSTGCRTLWGQGSHWENAAFFNFQHNNEALSALDFLGYGYAYPVNVTLRFTYTGDTPPSQIYLRADFSGMGRRLLSISGNSGEYVLHTRLMPGTMIQYQFFSALPAAPKTTLIPPACTDADGTISFTIPAANATIDHITDSCPTISSE